MSKKLLMLGVVLSAISVNTMSAEIKTSGFMTIAATQTDTKYEVDSGAYNRVSLLPDSVAAVQFDASIDQYTSATIQLVARGNNEQALSGKDNFEPDVEWAFVKIKPNYSNEIKIGRMRLPAFLLSETLEVGVTYPWVRAPHIMYQQIPTTELTGASYTYSKFLNDEWMLNSTIFWGAPIREEADIANQFGAVLNVSNDLHQIRFSVLSTKLSTDFSTEGLDAALSVADPLNKYSAEQISSFKDDVTSPFQDLDFLQASLGYIYDSENILFITETSAQEVGDSAIPSVVSAYATLAWRFETLTPHLTIAHAETTNDDKRDKFSERFDDDKYIVKNYFGPGVDFNPAAQIVESFDFSYLNNQRSSVTAGIRWDYSARSALNGSGL